VTTAQRLTRVAARLRASGFTVIEVSGWQTRGSGALNPRGHLEHHTAGSLRGDTPSLRVVTFGRAGLRNALCCWYVSRSGIIYLIAARAAWHAGSGSKGSNSTLSGTEAENTGVGEPWTDGSLAAQAAIAAEMAREFDFGASRVWDHKEHAPRRKIDRTGIDPAAWRRRVGILLGAAPAPPAPPAPPVQEDDVITPTTTGPAVEHVQRLANGINHRSTALGDFPAVAALTVDGVYGPKSQLATSHALGRAKHYLGVDLAFQPDQHVTPAEVALLVQAVVDLGRRLAAAA
jgi:hypothetical protein